MNLVDKLISIAATLFWWPVLVLDVLCSAFLLTVLPGRLRNGTVVHAASSLLLKAAGVRVQVQGLENIIKGKSQILVANHQSWFDSFVLAAVLPIPITFVSKKEMFRVPVYNYIMRRLRFVRVDRVNPHNDLRNIDTTASILQSHLSVVVFPEGVMSRIGELGPFKRGAVLLAAKANVSIVPITLIGTRRIKAQGSPWIHFGVQTEVIISEPVKVGGMNREEQRTAMENIRMIIERHLTDTEISGNSNNNPMIEVEYDATCKQ
jgi:1-acyl-sn-glycerol-3-phosphate acyltransferase